MDMENVKEERFLNLLIVDIMGNPIVGELPSGNRVEAGDIVQLDVDGFSEKGAVRMALSVIGDNPTHSFIAALHRIYPVTAWWRQRPIV